MYYLDPKYFLDEQKWIINKKLEKHSYEMICTLYKMEFNKNK